MTFEELLPCLAERAGAVDARPVWPAESWRNLAEAGVLRWGIPSRFGGIEPSAREFVDGYRRLAQACLTTCFILTQRNAACRRIADSPNAPLAERLLPGLATADRFATVGISHLTTSRQHLGRPAVRAEFDGTTIRLNGTVPWVSGAEQADWIVTGGAVADGRQVLVAVPTRIAGVRVGPSVPLLALTASRTAEVTLDDVAVPADCLLFGPVAGVLQQGDAAGTGSLTTSALAVGVCGRGLEMIQAEAERRPDLDSIVRLFTQEYFELADDLLSAAESAVGHPRLTPTAIRRRANSLAIRITQAALAVSKGAGFVQGHPAERAVREAMFFLVWSCPQPVVLGVLEEWACRGAFPAPGAGDVV